LFKNKDQKKGYYQRISGLRKFKGLYGRIIKKKEKDSRRELNKRILDGYSLLAVSAPT